MAIFGKNVQEYGENVHSQTNVVFICRTLILSNILDLRFKRFLAKPYERLCTMKF
jgi:hypothetical protein